MRRIVWFLTLAVMISLGLTVVLLSQFFGNAEVEPRDFDPVGFSRGASQGAVRGDFMASVWYSSTFLSGEAVFADEYLDGKIDVFIFTPYNDWDRQSLYIIFDSKEQGYWERMSRHSAPKDDHQKVVILLRSSCVARELQRRYDLIRAAYAAQHPGEKFPENE